MRHPWRNSHLRLNTAAKGGPIPSCHTAPLTIANSAASRERAHRPPSPPTHAAGAAACSRSIDSAGGVKANHSPMPLLQLVRVPDLGVLGLALGFS